MGWIFGAHLVRLQQWWKQQFCTHQWEPLNATEDVCGKCWAKREVKK